MTDKKDDTPPKPPTLNVVYPDASAIFAFAPAPVADIVKEGMIVLDTNALLVPYKTGRASLDEIKKTYKHLISAKRLVVPGQVAREFARHRPEQLKNLYQQIAARRQGQPKKDRYPLLAELDEYKKLLAADEKVDKALEGSREATEALLSTVKSWLWNDPISSLYRELFKEGVVVDQPIKAGFDEDLQRRASDKIPPGYKDAAKDEGGPGDLLIWDTILDVGQREKKHAMFVTGEEKSDWWHRSSDGPLYPRYELLEEYRRASDGHTFHIMSFADLLRQFGAKEDVVEEVRREQTTFKDVVAARLMSGRQFVTEQAVRKWLLKLYESVNETGSFPDFWVETATGRMAAEIKLVGLKQNIAPKLDRLITDSWGLRVERRIPLLAFFVASTRKSADLAETVIQQHLKRLPEGPRRMKIAVGFLTEDGTFNEISLFNAGSDL